MPLIVICGKPLTGKSLVANSLRSHFGESKSVLVTDEKLLRDDGPESVYRNEKENRSLLKSDVKRALETGLIVILDSTNYIKGFRYELSCLAKHSKTPFILVECLPPKTEDILIAANQQFDDVKRRYPEELLRQLSSRYEPPYSVWEKPLFKIEYDKDNVQKSIPYDQIDEAVFRAGNIVQNRSTKPLPLASGEPFKDLVKETSNVIDMITNAIKEERSNIQIPDVDETIELTQTISVPQLHKLRRDFINFRRSQPLGPNQPARIRTEFVQFIKPRICSD